MIANLAAKNAMFNLNESNRMVMSQHPTDSNHPKQADYWTTKNLRNNEGTE